MVRTPPIHYQDTADSMVRTPQIQWSGNHRFNSQDTADSTVRTLQIQLSEDRTFKLLRSSKFSDLKIHSRSNEDKVESKCRLLRSLVALEIPLGINMSIQVCLCLFVIGKSWNARTCLSDAPVCLICVWNSGDQNSFTLHSPVKPNQLKRESIIIRRTRSGIIYEIFWEIHLIPFFSNYIPPRVHILG